VPPQTDERYSLTVELNVLNHLGINLYSNIAAVLSEIVANAWDADASIVTIEVDKVNKILTVADDGVGMNLAEVNERYLNVGFQRRPELGKTTPRGRAPMGRKGIGKLSLFSAADTVRVYTKTHGDEQQAFEMNLPEIKMRIKSKGAAYHPVPITPIDMDRDHGTIIKLSSLRHGLSHTGSALRRRIARRFGVVGKNTGFRVMVDACDVEVSDRDYFSKLQMIWYFGENSKSFVAECKTIPTDEKDERYLRYWEERPADLPSGHKIAGWIGTVFEPRQLKDIDDESINHVVIMARGKLVQEDMLSHMNDGGLYTKYIVGEVYADHLDVDDEDDITTSSRQQLIEGDPRFEELRKFLRTEMKHIETVWGDKRKELSLKAAFNSGAIKKWFDQLPKAQRPAAEAIPGEVGNVSIDKEEDRYELYEHAILAFETLAVKDRLNELKIVDLKDLPAVAKLFAQVDDIEATRYYEVTSLRVNALSRIKDLVDENAREKLIQQQLFDHLYLLDASWERATDETPHMEATFRKIFAGIKFPKGHDIARVDIRFKKVTGTHVVVELKRPDRDLTFIELLEQVKKYHAAMSKGLDLIRPPETFEIVLLIGRLPGDWNNPATRSREERILRDYNTRVVTYSQLLEDAYAAYASYIEHKKEAGRVMELIDKIRVEKATFHQEQEKRKEQAAVAKRQAIALGEIGADHAP
jgi:hypothetical protein